MEVHILPCLQDNYSYLLVDNETKLAACVDPVEAVQVLKAAEDLGVTLTMGLCTHKHWDHSSGNEMMCKIVRGFTMIGSAYEDTPGITQKMSHNDTVELGTLVIQALHVPCHTRGHLIYYVKSKTKSDATPLAFTGDTLFVGGCGRFFEGTAEEMHYALNTVIAQLPKETLLYCGHEYTKANLAFAKTVDKENINLDVKYELVVEQSAKKEPTVPSTVADEMQTNPFMRVHTSSIKAVVGGGDTSLTDVECMHKLRELKNVFKSK